MHRRAIMFSALLVSAAFAGRPVQAATFLWTGIVSNEWSGGLNWAPVGTPGDTDAVTIDDTQNNPVILTADVAFGTSQENGIDGLTISDGASLNTSNFFLHVDGGATTVTGADSTLTVGLLAVDPTGFALDADSLDVLSSATLELHGAHVDIDSDMEIDTSSSLIGWGDVLLGSLGSTSVLNNRGTIEVGAIFNGGVGELTLRTPGGATGATLDLDGSDEAGNLDVNDNSAPVLQQSVLTLNVETPLTDGFSGLLDIGARDTANFAHEWTLESGTIQLAGGTAAPATLSGAKVSNLGGDIVVTGEGIIESEVGMAIGSQVNVEPGAKLVLASDYTSTGGSRDLFVKQNATVQFDGTGVINNGATLNLEAGAQLIVNGDLTVDRGTSNFDWDGSADDAETTVTGLLTVGADGFDANGYSSTLNINEGSVSVDVDGFWIMRGTLNMTSGTELTSLQTVSGTSSALFEGATINAGGTGTAIINSVDNQFDNAVTVTVDSDAALHILNPVVDGGTWGGAGTLQLTNLEVNGPTTMNLHTVNPNGNTQINDQLTLNVTRVSQFGPDELITGNITITEEGQLNVQFEDPEKSWTLPGASTMHFEGVNFGLSDHLAGAPVLLQGDVTVTGHSAWLAEVTIEGLIDTDPGGFLQLYGRMAGGKITGDSILLIDAARTLVGFGDIELSIASPGNAAVLADDGTLNIRAPVNSLQRMGTADSDGVLNFDLNFDTDILWDALELNGGSVTGLAIINGDHTRGHGVINSNSFQQTAVGLLEALGGELIVDVVDLTIDVLDGTIQALAGDLTFADPLSGPFVGAAEIGSTHAIDFQQGWTLGAGGTLTFAGTDITAPQVHGTTVLQGAAGNMANVNINASSTAFAEFADHVTFGTHVEVDVPNPAAELRLLGGALIEGTPADQTMFVGDGSLVNLLGSELIIADELTVGVNLRNRGKLVPGNSAGTIGVLKDFTNFAEGSLEIELIAGPGGVDHDQVNVTDTATLAGTLDLVLSGFTPAYGAEYLIMTAAAINGSFDSVLGVEVFSDRYLAVIYNGTEVKTVVALPGDANLDGTVDGADFLIWNTHKFTLDTSWETGDFNGDGTTDGFDFLVWNNFKFMSADMNSPVSVPEPAGLLLVLVGWCFLTLRSSRNF